MSYGGCCTLPEPFVIDFPPASTTLSANLPET